MRGLRYVILPNVIRSGKSGRSTIAMQNILVFYTMCASLILISSTGRAQECSPNYDPCVPVASDVDCAGGSGDGPVYVAGPILIVGADIYGLDRDGDGVACEPK